MAPVYALMISFGIVALSGVVVGQGAQGDGTQTVTVRPPAPPKAPKVRFRTKDEKPALMLVNARIVTANDVRIGVIDQQAEFLLPVTDRPFTFCVYLPPNLTSPDATQHLEQNLTCWGPIQPSTDTDVHVEPRK